ncbi:GNAT family N-acetyltransferase (plasmid) [Sinorhizobium chiapasense]|uniref:GNAT family N-acetyltransferase n=1 Tax=Sinorhizobium chiapasense TaxID=501572 RepID=UPI002FE032D5
MNTFSLGWACLRLSAKLAGFVNVAWNGGVHAFLFDMVAAPWWRKGYARRLVEEAVANARLSEWLHVDFEAYLHGFYFEACGFVPTDAGLIRPSIGVADARPVRASVVH